MLGICTNARGCWPLPSEAYELGLVGGGWLRSIVYSFEEFDRALQTTPANVRVCALLRKECQEVGSNYEHWDQAVMAFAQRFRGRVHAVECDNEADLNGDPPSHSVDLLRRAKLPLTAAGMHPILTSVAGPNWQEYLAECRSLLGADADGCWAAFHPYGSRAGDFPSSTWGFGELGAQIRRAHDLIGLPIAVTEFGIKIRDAGGEQGHATYIGRADQVLTTIGEGVLAFATLFCLGDEMGSPGEQGQDGFGLRRLDGSHRPAWQVFAQVNGGPLAQPPAPTPPPVVQPPSVPPVSARPRYVLGFELWHNADRALLGEPLEDERGGIPGFSQQRTKRGILTAANIEGRGWELLFWEDRTGARFRFADGMSEKIA